jgi:hypothetical protein
MAQVLGLDAVLWIADSSGSGGIAGTYIEMTNARNVTLSLETAEADVTTRANSGWRATTPTLKDASVEFEMIYDTADAGFTEVQEAFLDDADVWVKVLDGTTRTTGGVGDHTTGDGLVAKCRVTNFSINQSLEEAVTVSVSLKPTYGTAPIWQS